MDKMKDGAQSRWAWLPAHMPRVAALIRDRRVELGSAFVDECWRRGVLRGEPGWFVAIEGPLMVGVPSTEQLDDVRLVQSVAAQHPRAAALFLPVRRGAEG